jgi:osmoprotectant transport system ATP-binding protein
MIRVGQLSKHFGGVRAVDGISFEVGDHQKLILLGPSGCGKTTTLKMINRLIEPTSGSIFIDGKNIHNQSSEILRRNIGYVLQNNGLFPHYTVAENIAIVPQLLKWDTKRIEKRIAELIEKLHLSKDQLKAYPNQLSGGQQQRVGLARALVADPPVLLMDEPFGALDNVTRSKIHAEFKVLDELKRKTIIMVTHDVQEAFELGDRICLMDKGKIVQIGTPTDLLYKPANHFVELFLKEQRLQLEFKTVRIKDIWNLLPHTKKAGTADLHANVSVWSVMESFKAKQAEHLNITLDDETRSIGPEQLITAFYRYQNGRTHE